MRRKSVLFLVPYPLHQAPSQRFRVELYLPYLEQNRLPYKVQTFLDAHTWKVLYSNSASLQKACGVMKGFLKRVVTLLFVVPRYEYIFIHREAAPVGPPIFEFLIAKVLRKKIIYDFDDAIWIPNTSRENSIAAWLKAFWKVKFICRWSFKVVGGNAFLCNYARQYNNQVVLIPTCVEMEGHHNGLKEQDTEKVIIGWTGSHSTMKYLDAIVPVLEKIDETFNSPERVQVCFLIISNKPPQFQLRHMHFIHWNETSEIQDLLKMNIGIMPLDADQWSEGKCGFKLIQYMSLGIPAVASPVGVNKKIIENGINGFLCTNEFEWFNALSKLIQHAPLRTKIGRVGKETIAAHYSAQANVGAFLDLFSRT